MKKRLLSVYFTAGYPELDSTLSIAESLQVAGVDFLEIGFPYSDPVADGPVIQHSSSEALKNGMSLALLFDQLAGLKDRIQIPVYLMGYFNPVLQFGVERFCEACKEVGIKGVIIPDLPVYEFEKHYQAMFEAAGVSFIFMVTPQTPTDRIHKIDALSRDFIYLLSSPSVTGNALAITEETMDYFKRIDSLNLSSKKIVGFGIRDYETFTAATTYTDGAIVGTAFVKLLEKENPLPEIAGFINAIRGN
jgi:tryptophan synthase alpha chain